MNRRVVSIVVAVVVVAALSVIPETGSTAAASARRARAAARFPSAAPGPHPVGHATVTVPPANGRPALTVDIWYPSRHTRGPKASYEIIPGVDIPALLAHDGATPAAKRFPLVVYSHGAGAFSVVATFFTEILASQGYVVAAPDHPGDTIIDAALGVNDVNYVRNVLHRISDLSRVITALTVPTASTPAWLTEMVDPSKIVASGQSLGGATAVGLASVDPRVDEVIAMDPTAGILNRAALAAVKVPVLMEWSADGINGLEPQEYDTVTGPWFQVEMPTAHHNGFTDLCSYQQYLPAWIVAIHQFDPSLDIDQALALFDFAQNCNPPTMLPRRLHHLADGYAISFLNFTLEGRHKWRQTLETSRRGAQFTSGGS